MKLICRIFGHKWNYSKYETDYLISTQDIPLFPVDNISEKTKLLVSKHINTKKIEVESRICLRCLIKEISTDCKNWQQNDHLSISEKRDIIIRKLGL